MIKILVINLSIKLNQELHLKYYGNKFGGTGTAVVWFVVERMIDIMVELGSKRPNPRNQQASWGPERFSWA